MKVLVTGATGFIGWHCASLLRDRGLAVSALLRPSSDEGYPLTHYVVRKNSAESAVKRLIGDSTVLRLCAVYGPRERDILRMFKLVAEKGYDIRPKGDSPLLSFIEGRDVAKAVFSAITCDVTKKKTY